MTMAREASHPGIRGERKAATLPGKTMPETMRPAAAVAPTTTAAADSRTGLLPEAAGGLCRLSGLWIGEVPG